MKRLYLLFTLIILSVSSTFAQDPIGKASELSNSKVYTIESGRASLQVITGGTCLYASTGTAEGITQLDETNANHQFAIINGGVNYYLYSVGAAKFVDKSGNLTDVVNGDVVINVVSTESEAYPINLNWGDSNYLNTQPKGEFEKGYIIDNWSTLDAGNQFQITPVGDFNDQAAIDKAKAFDATIIRATITYQYMCDGVVASTYTKVTQGVPPLTVTYDAPASPIGATCSDATPASKEITESITDTVTYNYTVDASTLPFTPTTVSKDGFAEGTKWYYIQPKDTKNFCYSSDDKSSINFANKNGIHPLDLHYMFAFEGNPLSGFQIYNYVKGAGQKVYTESGAYSGNATFSPSSDCRYFVEAGTSDGQYRFNQTTDANSYLNAYNSVITVYTYGDGWASDDAGSQYYITEVSDKEIAQAMAGVLSYDVSIPYGTVFRDKTAISSLQIMFENANNDVSLSIADNMKEGNVTFVDADGKVVATPKYAVNSEDKSLLDITFDPEFSTLGTYTLVVAEGLVKDAVSGLVSPEIKLEYQFVDVFEEKTVTARIWKKFDSSGYSDLTPAPNLPYATHTDGEYYTCKVKITGNDTFVLLDWLNTGAEKDTIKVQFDPTKTYYNVNTFNDVTELDSYGSSWLKTSIVLDGGYNGCYVTPEYSDASIDSEYGMCCIQCYSYDTNAYMYVIADWYMDDRYAFDETLTGKVHKGAFTDMNYDDKNYPAFQQLPYGDGGTYEISVYVSEKAIMLKNYTGKEGENLTIVFDPSSGSVTSFNNLPIDAEYGTSQITSTVLDGVSGYWYAYTGEYSYVSYDAATNSGWAIISGYSDATQKYEYLYVSIGNYNPVTTGIKSVVSESATLGNPAIYNVAGQRVLAPRKGIYIVNGKKVMY